MQKDRPAQSARAVKPTQNKPLTVSAAFWIFLAIGDVPGCTNRSPDKRILFQDNSGRTACPSPNKRLLTKRVTTGSERAKGKRHRNPFMLLHVMLSSRILMTDTVLDHAATGTGQPICSLEMISAKPGRGIEILER